VIKGRLLAGAFPSSTDDAETYLILTKLLELGTDTFVCLQAEFSMATPEAVWRSGQALRPYVKDAQRLLIQARATNSSRITQTRLDLLHLPIVDGGVTSDLALSKLADDCCQRILNGERLYVHCWGKLSLLHIFYKTVHLLEVKFQRILLTFLPNSLIGGHGRTGTIIAILLSRLYGLNTEEALLYTQALHDVRKYPQNVRSPQTKVQFEQVKRILGTERVGMKACEYTWPDLPLRPFAANEIHFGSQSLANPYNRVPLVNASISDSNLPVFIRPETSMSSAKAVAAAAAIDPPIRSSSLIPAGTQGGGESSSTVKRSSTSPQPSGSVSNTKVGLPLMLPSLRSSAPAADGDL
jgi:protein-tyrosine phosphatase